MEKQREISMRREKTGETWKKGGKRRTEEKGEPI